MLSLLKSADERAVGPARTYSLCHVILAVMEIGNSRSVGRHVLAQRAGVGEGAIRTIIARLTRQGYISVALSGCRLTAKGKGAYSELKAMIPAMSSLTPSTLTVGKRHFALVVRGASAKVSDGIKQRDAAVIAGASGATTYLVNNSKFQIPRESGDCERDFPSPTWSEIREKLAPKDGDVVILCGSDDDRLSALGAVSAALTLIG